MGGPGSGNWWRRRHRKCTVEECLVLPVKHFIKRQTGATGTIRWSCGETSSSISYRTDFTVGGAFVWLVYKPRGGVNVNMPVRLCSTPTQFNSHRLWFRCPLSLDGVPCGRRAGKLYLPPGTQYFGCRTCYHLTYRSAQRAHRAERMHGLFARLLQRYGPADNRASA